VRPTSSSSCFNSGTCAQSLSGWTLKYSSASGVTIQSLWAGAVTDSIPAGGYFSIGGGAFTGTKNGTISSGGLAQAGGGVALFDGNTKKDGVAWGTAASSHPFLETTAIVAPTAAQSAAPLTQRQGHERQRHRLQARRALTRGVELR
jgi:hypothetical protein